MKRSRWIADDVGQFGMSAIKDMAMRAAKIPDALSLTWGLPSFPTPMPICEAVARTFGQDADIGKYTLPNGLPELRNLAASHFSDRSGIGVNPDKQVVITAGNMEGIKTVLRAILNPGDEVIVTDPCFASHLLQITLCHGRAVFLKLNEDQDWQFDPAQLEDLVSSRTKAILLVNPHNPTGAVFDRRILEALGKVAQSHGLLVIVDDPYSPFIYDEPERANLSVYQPFSDCVAYLFTFSKAYAMSGWRVGYMILPPDLLPHHLKVHDATLICAPHISQTAAISALRDSSLPLEEFRTTLDRRRKLIMERIERLPQLFECVFPEGAYYVFPKLIGKQRDSWAFSVDLLARTGIAVTPGVAFGPTGEGHVRMAYCVDDETINGAFDRIERCLSHAAL